MSDYLMHLNAIINDYEALARPFGSHCVRETGLAKQLSAMVFSCRQFSGGVLLKLSALATEWDMMIKYPRMQSEQERCFVTVCYWTKLARITNDDGHVIIRKAGMPISLFPCSKCDCANAANYSQNYTNAVRYRPFLFERSVIGSRRGCYKW